MKIFKFAAAAATGLALLAGTAMANDKPKVGLIMKSLANEFFQNMMAGAEAHQEQRGDYELLAVGMQNETDFESQINAVENFITQGVEKR
jgi:ribose transport system substrate-binding protein